MSAVGTKNKCEHLVNVLVNTKRSLIDSYYITANLSQDLVGFKYLGPASSSSPPPKKRRRATASPVKASKQKINNSSEAKEEKPATPVKTIQEVANETDIDDSEAAKGFIDKNTGEKVYLIERIIKYEPGLGYLVHWQGYPKSERSWQNEKDMPAGFAKEMKAARKRYQESLTASPFSF